MFHRGHIVVVHPLKALHQGFEARLDLAVARGAQGGQGAAMKAAAHDDNGGEFDALLMSVEACQLNRRLIGLGPGVGEEHPLHARELAQPFGQL